MRGERFRDEMHLLFDLDGTLTDPREGIVACFKHALRTLSIEPPPDAALVRFIGPPLRGSLRELVGDDRVVSQALDAYRERFASTGMFENAVYPGVADALAALRTTGCTLLVVTSKPHHFATQILDHFDLARHFSGVYGAELSGERSDKSELLAHVLRDRALDPRDAIMIGDRSFDMLAARQTSVSAIGVLWGYGSRAELLAAGAEVLVATTEELVTHVRSRVQRGS